MELHLLRSSARRLETLGGGFSCLLVCPVPAVAAHPVFTLNIVQYQYFMRRQPEPVTFNEGQSETFSLSSRCVSGGFRQMMTFFPLSVFFSFFLFNSAAFHRNSQMCTVEQKGRWCYVYVLQVTKRPCINYEVRFCVFLFFHASSIIFFLSLRLSLLLLETEPFSDLVQVDPSGALQSTVSFLN